MEWEQCDTVTTTGSTDVGKKLTNCSEVGAVIFLTACSSDVERKTDIPVVGWGQCDTVTTVGSTDVKNDVVILVILSHCWLD